MTTETPAKPRRRWRRILLWTLLPVLVLSLAMAPLSYLAFLRGAEMAPEEFLDNGGANGGGPVVAMMGASTVHGICSADFVTNLRERMGDDGYRFVNAGVNGSTSADLLERVGETVDVNPDAVAILVGSNNVTDAGKLETKLSEYRQDIDELAQTLTDKTDAEIAFYSLQPLGEDLDDDDNKRVTRFNEAISEVAEDNGAAYLPLNETLADMIRAEGGSKPSDYSVSGTYLAGLRHYYFGQSWNEISAANGYTVLTDGLHLNDRGADAAADLGEDWLRELELT